MITCRVPGSAAGADADRRRFNTASTSRGTSPGQERVLTLGITPKRPTTIHWLPARARRALSGFSSDGSVSGSP